MSRSRRSVRCAIYTRVSTEAGLEQEFNSLEAQYDTSEAYIRSQACRLALSKARYDDGGFSGGSTDQPCAYRKPATPERSDDEARRGSRVIQRFLSVEPDERPARLYPTTDAF